MAQSTRRGDVKRRDRVYYSRRKRRGLDEYSYIDANGREKVFYANMPPERDNPLSHLLWQLIPYFIVLICLTPVGIYGYRMGRDHIQIPQKLEYTDEYFTGTYIDDPLKILSSREQKAITESLERLRDESGVIPLLHTVYMDSLSGASEDRNEALESYGLSYYRSHFLDESHLLLLYGVYKDDENNRVWSQVQGDSTVYIFNEDRFYTLQDKVQKSLNKAELSPGEAISKSVDDITPLLFSRTWTDYLFGFLPLWLYLLFLFVPLFDGIRGAYHQVKINEYLDCINC